MTDEEIEVVAEALALAGGCSWYPGRTDGPLLRIVTDRYREQARIAIEAIERVRAQPDGSRPPDPAAPSMNGEGRPMAKQDLRPGATVIYRPPGERRAYPCRVLEIRGNRAYLEPILRACTGWVAIECLQPLNVEGISNDA
ncbi:hypothetical protein [Microvirga thermotolerans]|uniref:Uncharacterized protein n=1 Tax=Microvirga thermotolerans TaxID=2651334 RepID=A0A5P9JVQ9_9HYPH|nr:hypothetical protein [Microvirga thermotolerans]QFU15858.1 hypothetical protein GDR74_06270 [Microvirga thermotolerans]